MTKSPLIIPLFLLFILNSVSQNIEKMNNDILDFYIKRAEIQKEDKKKEGIYCISLNIIPTIRALLIY